MLVDGIITYLLINTEKLVNDLFVNRPEIHLLKFVSSPLILADSTYMFTFLQLFLKKCVRFTK